MEEERAAEPEAVFRRNTRYGVVVHESAIAARVPSASHDKTPTFPKKCEITQPRHCAEIARRCVKGSPPHHKTFSQTEVLLA